jgi:ketosteroid isomerase-like protein
MGSFDVMMVTLRFNEKINARNLEGLYNVMTEDHIFIDSENDVDEGKAVMTEGWRNFTSFPDYRNIFT